MPSVNHELRDPTYEAVVVGEPIGPVRVVADKQYQRRGAFALGNISELYAESSGTLVPAPMVAGDLVALFFERYDPNRTVGLHQKEEVWFHRPIEVGSTLAYTGRYTDKFEKRSKGYTVFESEARDVITDELCVRQRSTEIMRIPADIKVGAASSGMSRGMEGFLDPNWPEDVVPRPTFEPDISVGTPLVPLVRTAHQAQMSIFSGGDKHRQTVHTSIEVARAAGFRSTLAQGMMETCWVAEMLASFVGASWHESGYIRMVYLQPVFEGDTITCRAVVTAVQGDSLSFEVWTENQDGLRTSVGHASAKVSHLSA